MRPAGEIRQAVQRAAWDLAVERAQAQLPGPTWHDLAARLAARGIARRAVRDTVKNLARTGALCGVGEVRVPGSMRALQAYMPAQLVAAPASPPGADLAQALRGWVA